jgi:hypothetical protein
VVRSLVAAWDGGDADGFGAAFARSATYVTGAGRRVRGRSAIADLVRESDGNVRIVGRIAVQSRGTAGTARFRWSLACPRGHARCGVVACAMKREGTTWLIRSLDNQERGGARRRRRKDR